MNSSDISKEDASIAKSVDWYRCPIDKEEYKRLLARSDFKGLLWAGGNALLIVATAALSLWLFENCIWLTPLGLLLHGTVCGFMPAAVHELIHGTVFKTRWLHTPFLHFFAFIGWQQYEIFNRSHACHHRFTLHPPEDLEVVLPQRLTRKVLWRNAWWNYYWMRYCLLGSIAFAKGKFEGKWHQMLFPENKPALRVTPIRWARTLLVAHGLILVVSIWQGWWLLPVLTSLTPLYANGLYLLCGHTQHIGLQDHVSDFRLCCRTFTVNPIVRFLYWNMNYHIEHHMFAAVPCYNLHRLHKAIRHDLPPCTHGLLATWKEIFAILDRQQADPTYQHVQAVPQRSEVAGLDVAATA